MTDDKFEYYLTFWGEIENDSLVGKELGLKGNNFWFDTEPQRSDLRGEILDVAKKHNVIVAFNEEAGTNVRYKTIAKMKLVMPDGKEYPYKYDFGYAYPVDGAHYMFHDGNYACDCNLSSFISEEHPEVKELDCGDTIKIKDFEVTCVR